MRATSLTALWALLSALGCHPAADLEAPAYEAEEPVAEEPVAEAEPEPPPPPRVSSEPFVWRVTKDGKSSHLFGTVHVGVTLEQAMTPALLTRAKRARVVMLEIDPADMDPQVLLAAARLPEGERQDRMYPPPVWHDIANALNATINEQTLRVLRPWFTMLLYLQARVAEMHDGAPPEGMDLSLYRLANHGGVEVRALEEVSDQIDALGSVPDDTVARMMTEMVREEASAEGELSSLLDAYLAADPERMERLIFDPDEMREMPEFYEALFDRRNEAWMEPLLRELGQGDAFVAVGLGHLLSDGGLLERLRRRGWRVERVSR